MRGQVFQPLDSAAGGHWVADGLCGCFHLSGKLHTARNRGNCCSCANWPALYVHTLNPPPSCSALSHPCTLLCPCC